MYDAIRHALEGDSPEEEDDQDDVWVNGSDVDDLGILRDALDHAQVDQGPGHEQTQPYDPVEVVRVLDIVWDVQSIAVPKILRWATDLKRDFKIFRRPIKIPTMSFS